MKLWLTREWDDDGSEFKSFWTAKPEYSLGRWRGPRDERVQVPLQALEALPWPDEVGPKGIREVELVWPGAVLQGPTSGLWVWDEVASVNVEDVRRLLTVLEKQAGHLEIITGLLKSALGPVSITVKETP